MPHRTSRLKSAGQDPRGAAFVLIAFFLLAGCSANNHDPKAVLTEGATTLLQFYETGDTSGLRQVFTASMLNEVDMPGLLQQRNDFAASLGALRESKGPNFVSDNEATIELYFENKNLEMTLGFDTAGLIAFLDLTNLAPDSLIPQVTWADLGGDTLRIERTDSFGDFRDDFMRDSGRVRVVTLLSPT